MDWCWRSVRVDYVNDEVEGNFAAQTVAPQEIEPSARRNNAMLLETALTPMERLKTCTATAERRCPGRSACSNNAVTAHSLCYTALERELYPSIKSGATTNERTNEALQWFCSDNERARGKRERTRRSEVTSLKFNIQYIPLGFNYFTKYLASFNVQ